VFSDNLLDDAQRRDFTMNALYATRNGTVLDPTGQGLPDLVARRLRFIGPPEDRIHEDYLRILRFFRFHAWYADPDAGFDRDGLAACAQLSGGIDNLARERVGAEMRKLLAAPDPAPSVATMAQAGVLSRILPGADARLLPLLIAFETGIDPDPVRRLACLGGTDPTAMLRLSKTDSKALAILRDGMASATTPGALGYRYGTDRAQDIVLLRAAQFETPPKTSDLDAARSGAGARFPVTSADLMPRFTGPALGAELARLESRWINSGFTLTRAALLTDHQG
jgi:poly(A) polymerase